jgi:nucleoside-diphosphate-sugar epimerase
MKKILLSGAGGNLGTDLQAFFENQGNQVIRYDRNGNNDLHVDCIVHCAGLSVESSRIPWNDYQVSNVDLTQRVYEEFSQSTASTLVFFSTAKVYGRGKKEAFHEESPLLPLTKYARSKAMAEALLRPITGKRIFIVRPAMVYGTKRLDGLTKLVKQCERLGIWPFMDFKKGRSVCSVELVQIAVNAMLINESMPQGVYNLADYPAISLAGLGEELKHTHSNMRLWALPTGLFQWAESCRIASEAC